MKEKKLYVCELCNTVYADKEHAKRCESNHVKLDNAEFTPHYISIGSDATGMPNYIIVHVNGEEYKYRR